MKESLKILLVSTEVNPYSKSGGLGDVAASLPKALRKKSIDIRVVLPLYKSIPQNLLENAREVCSFNVQLAWRHQTATIFAMDEYGDGVSIYFIKNDYYFTRDSHSYYGHNDDYERFSFFTKAAIEMLTHIDFQADILHFNDWHTGLGPTFLRDIYRQFTYYANMKSLFTIHNLNYQGIFGREVLGDMGLNDGYFTSGDLEFHGKVSTLKAGILHADAVSTVSQTYAQEIQTSAYGYGMEGILHKRGALEGKLYGITNGIDTTEYNPETDPRIYVNFNNREKKRENKRRLQADLGLPISDVPIISMVTRLAEQKGFDIISIIMDELISLDIQLVVLGTGEGRYENMLRHYGVWYPDKVSANLAFDATLAQRIYAGSDMFLMPSVYEPYGLGQLFAMRYGTIPIVRKTGGLSDTVKHFDAVSGTGNGFLFEHYVASGLMWAIREALNVYHTPDWDVIVENALSGDYSWNQAADAYIDMYQEVFSRE